VLSNKSQICFITIYSRFNYGFKVNFGLKPIQADKVVREEVFGEFIEPFANSTASGGGKSITGNLWGSNKTGSAFINTLDDQITVSASRSGSSSLLNPVNTGIRVGSAGYDFITFNLHNM